MGGGGGNEMLRVAAGIVQRERVCNAFVYILKKFFNFVLCL